MYLVTGATGFIGNALIRRLLKEKRKVMVIVRMKSDMSNLEGLDVDIFTADLTDFNSLANLPKDIDTIYHCAGLMGAHNVTYNDLYNANVIATSNLLRACHNVKRFIYLSSRAAMGYVKEFADENTECKPYTDYDKSKYYGEQEVINSNIPYTIIRAATVYGPGEMATKAKLFSYIMRRKCAIIGDGLNYISLVYIDDLINSLWLASNNEIARNQIYIISDKPYQIKDFFNTIADEIGVRRPRHMPKLIAYIAALGFEVLEKLIRLDPPLKRERVANLTASFSYNTTKAKNELGFIPKTNLRDGVRKSAWWYRDKGVFYVPYLRPNDKPCS